mgnify:CR=1 FL=1
MKKTLILMLALGSAGLALSGCAAAIGAAGVLAADEIMEQEHGGDGLF